MGGGGDIFCYAYVRWGVGFRFPSISLHKKLSQLLVEEWEASPADPALLLHFSETILSNLNLKI